MPSSLGERVNAVRACFDAYDLDKDGKLNATQMKAVLRALNRPYTETELDQIATANDEPYDYYTVAGLAAAKPATGKAVKDAFLGLSQNSTVVSADTLKFWLTTMGEELSAAEVDEMLSFCEVPAGGTFDIRDFLDKLAALYLNLHDEHMKMIE
jgi:Ca2+-binding EF-hand superfamily protein